MNFKISYARTALFIAAMFLSLNAAMAIDPHDPSKHNWANSMAQFYQPYQPYVCVALGSNNLLYINLYLYAATSNVNTAPRLYFKYKFEVPAPATNPTVITGVTTYVTNSMMVPTTFYGSPAFFATLPMPYNSNPHCNYNGPGMASFFNFSLEYQAVMEDPLIPGAYVPYPYGAYPSVWPPAIFSIIDSPSYVDYLHTESKLICCYGTPDPRSSDDTGEVSSNSSVITDQQTVKAFSDNAVDGLWVLPNPFSSDIAVRLETKQAEKVLFECVDLQGKRLASVTKEFGEVGVQETSLNYAELPPGIYYLRVSTNSWSKMAKLVKVD